MQKSANSSSENALDDGIIRSYRWTKVAVTKELLKRLTLNVNLQFLDFFIFNIEFAFI